MEESTRHNEDDFADDLPIARPQSGGGERPTRLHAPAALRATLGRRAAGTAAMLTRPARRQPMLRSHVRARATGDPPGRTATPSFQPLNHGPEEHGSIPCPIAPCLRALCRT